MTAFFDWLDTSIIVPLFFVSLGATLTLWLLLILGDDDK